MISSLTSRPRLGFGWTGTTRQARAATWELECMSVICQEDLSVCLFQPATATSVRLLCLPITRKASADVKINNAISRQFNVLSI